VEHVRLSDITRISFESLRDRKFRFALNLIGILIGCTAVTGLVSITQGLSDEVSGQLQFFGPQNIMVIPGQIQRGRGLITTSLNWKDLEVVIKTSGVSKATPIVANKFCTIDVKGRSFYVEVYGITNEYFDLNQQYKAASGRTIIRTDNAAVVVGANIAHPSDEADPLIRVGDRIKIKSRVGEEEKTLTLRVVGIYERTGGSFGANLDDSIGIPLRTAQQFFEVGNEYDFILAQAESLEIVTEVAERIEDVMGDGFMIMSYETAQEQVDQVMGTIESVLGGIAAISLIVAGVGIINTMTVSVMERTREIGVLKAIGAKSRDVLFMFLSEAAMTGFLGGVLGAVLGFVLSQIIGNIINMRASPSLDIGLFVVIFAMTTAVISGLYPAWRASSLNPVEALRYE